MEASGRDSRAVRMCGIPPCPINREGCLLYTSESAKDLADYQRLTAEGKLGEAGQKLEELKRVLDKLNTRPK